MFVRFLMYSTQIYFYIYQKIDLVGSVAQQFGQWPWGQRVEFASSLVFTQDSSWSPKHTVPISPFCAHYCIIPWRHKKVRSHHKVRPISTGFLIKYFFQCFLQCYSLQSTRQLFMFTYVCLLIVKQLVLVAGHPPRWLDREDQWEQLPSYRYLLNQVLPLWGPGKCSHKVKMIFLFILWGHLAVNTNTAMRICLQGAVPAVRAGR